MYNKVNKGIDLIKSKLMIKFKQKIYKGNNYDVKYVLDTNKHSEDLIVIFTACTKKGQPARYNYVRTLDKYKCNKLFILDDFGFDGRGAYYLGKNKDFNIEKEVHNLIIDIIKELNIKRKFFVGSSKGGYASLYFGLDIKDSIIIAGAPQYMLGNYLNIPGHQEILDYIMGERSESSIDYLNNLLKKKIDNSGNNSIYIHYSTNDETYETDIKALVLELDKARIKTVKDIKDYGSHAELSNYFPQFIKSSLDREL